MKSKKQRNKEKVLQGIKEAILEIKQAKKEGRQLQTFDDFIKELESEK